MGDTIATNDSNHDTISKPSHELVSDPSKIIKCIEETLLIDGISLSLTLITMKRSFFLVISNTNEDKVHQVDPFDMMRGFSASDLPIEGLSMALGKHNTTIIDSSNSLASASLATKLSEKLNRNRPVYVANNFQLPYDYVNPDMFMSKLHLKLYQFVQTNYSSAE